MQACASAAGRARGVGPVRAATVAPATPSDSSPVVRGGWVGASIVAVLLRHVHGSTCCGIGYVQAWID
jgi:hypothetical protein